MKKLNTIYSDTKPGDGWIEIDPDTLAKLIALLDRINNNLLLMKQKDLDSSP